MDERGGAEVPKTPLRVQRRQSLFTTSSDCDSPIFPCTPSTPDKNEIAPDADSKSHRPLPNFVAFNIIGRGPSFIPDQPLVYSKAHMGQVRSPQNPGPELSPQQIYRHAFGKGRWSENNRGINRPKMSSSISSPNLGRVCRPFSSSITRGGSAIGSRPEMVVTHSHDEITVRLDGITKIEPFRDKEKSRMPHDATYPSSSTQADQNPSSSKQHPRTPFQVSKRRPLPPHLAKSNQAKPLSLFFNDSPAIAFKDMFPNRGPSVYDVEGTKAMADLENMRAIVDWRRKQLVDRRREEYLPPDEDEDEDEGSDENDTQTLVGSTATTVLAQLKSPLQKEKGYSRGDHTPTPHSVKKLPVIEEYPSNLQLA
ncbi:hypothetical protein FRC03_006695 [Tulasnella sp. 419]|nr:hypothetical protein FRC03_006695 [Tulasnella sp. 419]